MMSGGFDERTIRSRLSLEAAALMQTLDLPDVVDSTNSRAIARVAAGDAKRYVCVAQKQTAGRGRRGRPWISPLGGNIYCSVAWPFAGGILSTQGLSLAIGVAIVEALHQAGITGVQLKWPNDVVYCGRKLAGVLIEINVDAVGCCYAIAGVGLNVSMPDNLAQGIDQPWIDVASLVQGAEFKKNVSRDHLLVLLLNEMLPLLAHFESDGFRPYRQRWQQLDAYAGKRICVGQGKKKTVGWARGVDGIGRLQMDTATGRCLFHDGEISLRSL